MSDETTTTVVLHSDGNVYRVRDVGTRQLVKSQTDWDRFDALTEEEVTAAALEDPANPPLTDEDLAHMELVPNVYIIRTSLEMSQLEFSEAFHIPLLTLKDWEQGPIIPDASARAYLRVIEQDPEMVKAALAKSYRKAS